MNHRFVGRANVGKALIRGAHMPAIVLLLLAGVGPGAADPLDETYRETFYITPIGGWDLDPDNDIQDYLESMLQDNGGQMPTNLKVGISLPSTWFLRFTMGDLYEYIYSPWGSGNETDLWVERATANDVVMGTHVNGIPWGDVQDQDFPILHNYLETYNGGELLQVDRNGFIRRDDLAQDPTIDEQGDPFAPYLEMQLSLSRYSTVTQALVGRNARMAMRHWAWYREEHPDIILFASGSSEFRMNGDANQDFCDYSTFSRREFRDWLRGAGLYTGDGQYADLATFNAAFSGEPGFPFATWDDVEPPTAIDWSGGSWWSKWHEFRVHQIQAMTEQQMIWHVEAGLSPDRSFSHQTNEEPGGTGFVARELAAPYTTSFSDGSANGITTYGGAAGDSTLFGHMTADDRNWGIFEYNPLNAGSVSANRNALEAAWNGGVHLLCPYVWFGQGQFQIKGTVFETALRDFVADHAGDSYTALERWEVAPDSNDVIWSLSEDDDIEARADLSPGGVSTGTLQTNVTGTAPRLELQVDEGQHVIVNDRYYAASFRMHMDVAAEEVVLFWTDVADTTHRVAVAARAGWHVYRVNLAPLASWREKGVKAIGLELTGASIGTRLELDWVRLHAGHSWHMDHPDEVHDVVNFSTWQVNGGQFSGTSGEDGYFFFSTDKRSGGQRADRAFINADFYKIIRVRITADAQGTGEFFWWHRGDGPTEFSNYAFPTPVQAGTATYTFDMSGVPEWSGQIGTFRIDPVNLAGIACSIDYLTITPKMLPPRPLTTDLVINSSEPVFEWDRPAETGYASTAFDLELDDDFFFGTPEYRFRNLTDTRKVIRGWNRPHGLYWWRLRQVAADGGVSPWSVPFPIYIRPWTFDRVDEIALANNLDAIAVSDGVLSAQTTGADPFFAFNNDVNKDRGINAANYTRLRFRARLSGSGPPQSQVFFFPRSGVVPFAFINVDLPRDGQWHTVEVDMTRNAEWRDYISYVRLDPTGTSGVTFEIDSAELLPDPAPTGPNRARFWRVY